MDLNALRLFVAAAQAGTLSAAARRSGVPLPTLSRRVRRLEDELGVRLLERGTQGLRLTPEGTRLLEDAEPALAIIAQARDRLRDEAGIAGTLRISVPPSFQPAWPLVSDFCRDHPAVRFDMFVTDRTVDLVADGVDVSIDVVREGSEALRGRTLARYRHMVIAAPAFLERHPVRAPADLTEVPVGCFRTRTEALGVWSLGDEQVKLTPRLATNDYLHLRRVALSGEVVTELPPFLAAGPIREGSLVPVLESHPMPGREVRGIVPETRWTSPLVRQFLDTCAKVLPVEIEMFPRAETRPDAAALSADSRRRARSPRIQGRGRRRGR